MKFYKEILMDHYQNPRHRGRVDNPDFATAQYNPSCGDSVSFEGVIEDGVLKELYFGGKGCVISQATASLFTEFFVGKRIDDILSVEPEILKEVLGMELGPTRVKCALLSLVALKEGIAEYKKGEEQEK
ncbi:iron-sulfur cluster assembly scaffold protein [Candidatus Dependentiae bacterium]